MAHLAYPPPYTETADGLRKTRLAQLVNVLLLFIVVLAAITCVVLLLAVPSWPVTLYVNIATIVMALLLYGLVRRGYAHSAGIAALIFVSCMIALDSFNPNRTFGLGTPIVPLLLVFAGVIYGRKGLIVTAGASCVWLLTVSGLKLAFLPLSTALTRQQIIDASFYSSYIAIAGLAVDFVQKRVRQADLHTARLQQHQNALGEALQEVNHATNELLHCSSLDELWQRTVEITRDRLGIERCSIYVLTPEHKLHGTYGTRMNGQTMPIQHDQFSAHSVAERLNLYTPEQTGPTWTVRTDEVLLDPPPMLGQPPQPVGRGWVVTTAIRSSSGAAIAVMFNDNAIRHGPIDPVRQDLLAVYCSLLGSVAERRRLHDEALRSATLRERNRLARELHDSVSQSLYGIVMGTHTALKSIRDLDKATIALEYVLKQSEAGLTEMRALIFELRPEHLEHEGLMAALRRQVNALCANSNLRLSVEIDTQEPDITLDCKEVAYRIGIEAVRNVLKHAQATELRVSLTNTQYELRLEIYDNGRGFNTQVIPPGHLGVQSMRERAAQIRAGFDLDSAPGKGTLLRLVVPIREERRVKI